MVERDGTEREGGECAAREAVGGEEEVGVERASCFHHIPEAL